MAHLHNMQHRRSVQAQIEQLWTELAHDPAQQALACAGLCLEHAPQLAEWLKTRILAEMSDVLFKQLLFAVPLDARIQALNLLAGVKPQPRPKPQPVPIPAPQITNKTKPAHQGLILFGVPIRVVGDAEDRQLRCDAELGRLAVALWLANQFRIWIVARELDRQAGGSGYVTKTLLKQKLKFFGVNYTDRQLRRLLLLGEGVFWRQDRKHRDRLYLASWKRVSLLLIAQAEAQHIEIGYNRPGTRQQYVDVSGSLEAWQSRLYAAWIAYRAGEGGLSIARATQAKLFNRSEKTIRQWEADHLQGVVTKRYDFEQHPDDVRTQNELYDLQGFVPDHAESYTATTNQGIVERRFWQRPNTYVSIIKSHAHRGQARKVRKIVNSVTSVDNLTTEPLRIRSNYTVEQHKKRVKSLKFRRGLDGDVMQPVHVFIGSHNRYGVWELMIPDPGAPNPITGPNERRGY